MELHKALILFIVQLYLVLGDLPRLPNNELLVGTDRDLPGAETIDCRQGELIHAQFKRSTTVTPSDALTQQTFQADPFTSHAVVPGALIHGGVGSFSFTKVTYGIIGKRTGYALQINAVAGTGESAYWLPQGGVIDVPQRPTGLQPKYVFTPDFSGCSWTVTPMSNGMLRLRHVEGGKEVQQFNNLSEAQKGGPVTYAMQYKDYGYIHKNGRLIEHMRAYAYMHFSGGQWILYVQHQTCSPHPGKFVYKNGQIETFIMTFYNQNRYSAITGTEFFRIL